LYLGGEKLKPRHYHHTKFHALFRVLTLVLLVTGAAAPGAQEGGVPGDPAAAEREIRLGEAPPAVSAPGPVSGFAVFRALLLLILAAAAVYGVVYAVKKLSRPRDTGNSHLRVLATTRLGPNRFVHVVALGTRGWLIGSGEGGVSHIADIQEQEALDALFLEESRRASSGPGRPEDFRSLLRRLGIKLSGPESPPAADPAEPGSPVMNIRRRGDRLRGL
jgi:flagellar biogenesis protein FliO